MKRLLFLGTMLAWTGAANAQEVEADASAQCSATAQGAPTIERIDAATIAWPTATTRVVQLDVVASLPDGRELNYVFSGAGGLMTSLGPRATWTVDGEGPFTAEIEVSATNDPCVSYASLTYTVDEPLADDPVGEEPVGEEPGAEEPVEEEPGVE